jgi:NAD(P)H-dependent FMN reductase
MPKIAIVVGTTREGRFADKPAQWVLDIAKAQGGADFEIVDLRDFPLPFFNEPRSPAWGPIDNPQVQAWSQKMAGYDGYVFITAEYNHSVSGVLKNALDYLYPEMNRKPAAFVGYGGVGAARAIEHLRLIAVELQMAPLRSAVHMGMTEFGGMLMHGKTFADFPYLDDTAKQMLTDLVWWTNTLKAGRDETLAKAA